MPDKIEQIHTLLAPLYEEVLGDTVYDIGGMWATELDNVAQQIIDTLEAIKKAYK